MMNAKGFKFFSSLIVILLLSVKLLGVHALIHASEDTNIDKCELCEIVVKDVQESLGALDIEAYEAFSPSDYNYVLKPTHYNSIAYSYSFSLQVLSRPPPEA